MDFEKLLKKELSNFYGCSKQINNYFQETDLSFLSKKVREYFIEYIDIVVECKDFIQEQLKEKVLNPTNTIDSIIQEITKNHEEIICQDIDNEIKSFGYKMSINRLMSYYHANLENIIILMDEPEVVDELESQLNQLLTIKGILLPITT